MTSLPSPSKISTRKRKALEEIERNFDWLKENTPFNRKFRQNDRAYHQFLIESDLRILEIGCGTGDLLASLNPSYGVGIDLSPKLISYAATKHPKLNFIQHDAENPLPFEKDTTFDVIIISDAIGYFDDIQQVLENLASVCSPETRIIISYYTKHWEALVKVAETLKIKSPQPVQNLLSTTDIEKICELSGYELIRKEYQQLIPIPLFGIDTFVNKFIATLPGIREVMYSNICCCATSTNLCSKRLFHNSFNTCKK